MKRDDAHKAADDKVCRDFLAGIATADEKAARAALARRIRDQMPVSLTRELLALAIDPDTKSVLPNVVPTRKVKFENPSSGHPPTWRRDAEIKHLMATQYLPEEADKAMKPLLRRYRKIDRLSRPEQRQLIGAIERARTGRGVLEAVYARAMQAHHISRRVAQRIWLGK